MDESDDGEGVVIFPDAEVLHAAHLLSVGEGRGEAFVEAEGFGGAVGGEEGAAHEFVLEEGGTWERGG